MNLRLTQRLSAKIKFGPLSTLPLHQNPWADWSARLFTANRVQYILLSHTTTLYSVVEFGRGVTCHDSFIKCAIRSIDEFMTADGLGLMCMNFIVPTTGTVYFGKALNRSVTGSMNELEAEAKMYLATGECAPSDVGFHLNQMPLSAVSTPEFRGYASPRVAIKQLRPPNTSIEAHRVP